MFLFLQIFTAVSFALIAVLLIIILKKVGSGGAPEIKSKLENITGNLQNTERALREELAINRNEINAVSRQNREELSSSLQSFGENFRTNVGEFNEVQRQKFAVITADLNRLVQGTETKLEKMRETVEEKLSIMQEDNSRKLEQIRATVDEKLHQTLEKRLGDSFRLVSERLELVQKGLGEMQSLAAGVGDLKKTLVNVKTRGTLGEIQLGNILEQLLTKEQYFTNVPTRKGSDERVEFAIKMPGHDHEAVLLPLDAKFPLEDYQRLLEAYDEADGSRVEEVSKQLEARVKHCAKTIRDKYLDPPHTTDFGIMFLPVEGLYAEVLRRTGLFETLSRDYRVVVTGPTTLAAFLNSLQMGFRTLAIEKHSSEVWSLLGTVKTEFGKFGQILDKTHKKLKEASNTIETASQKSRTIERKLRDVEELPSGNDQSSC